MTENFVLNAFRTSGEHPMRVKLMRDKGSGDAAGYCFVHFNSEETARTVLHKLNGKTIPHTNPPVRYKLNYAGPSNKIFPSHSDEFPLFVGDLSSEVDDYMLYRCLSARYPSVRTAKGLYLSTVTFLPPHTVYSGTLNTVTIQHKLRCRGRSFLQFLLS